MSPSAPSRRLSALYAIVAALAIFGGLHDMAQWFRGVPIDFRAFYAAGEVVAVDRADPYRVQPLLRRENTMPLVHEALPIVAPAPLPPYDLVALEALGRTPLVVAEALFGCITLAAGVATGMALARGSKLPLTVGLAVAFIAVLSYAIVLGQIAPISIAALACAAWALCENRASLGAAALLIALVEPHVAAGAVIATLLVVPRARPVLLAGLVAYAIVPTLLFGTGQWLEYAHTLALHATAEVHFPPQYSLTWFLVALGVAEKPALLAGSLSTVVLTLASLAVVVVARERSVRSGAVVLLPALAALIGGTFIHPHQLVFAIVPALWYLRPARRTFDSTWIVGMLVVPFTLLIGFDPHWPNRDASAIIAVTMVTAWCTIRAWSASLGTAIAVRKAWLVTSVLGAFFFTLVALHYRLHTAISPIAPIPADPNENASIAWRAYSDDIAAQLHSTAYLVAIKIATVFALVATAVITSRKLLAADERALGSATEPERAGEPRRFVGERLSGTRRLDSAASNVTSFQDSRLESRRARGRSS